LPREDFVHVKTQLDGFESTVLSQILDFYAASV